MLDSHGAAPARGRISLFAIIGMIVVAILLLVVIYFAWVGWSERGRPVPEVDLESTTDAPDDAPAKPAAPAAGT